MDTTTHPIPAGGVLDLKATFNLIPGVKYAFWTNRECRWAQSKTVITRENAAYMLVPRHTDRVFLTPRTGSAYVWPVDANMAATIMITEA